MNRFFILIMGVALVSLAYAKDEKAKDAVAETRSANAEIYTKHENELGVQNSKIIATEKHIRELLKEKNNTSDKVRLKEIIVEIKKGLKERAETIKKYNKEYNFVKYELPHRGKDFDKRYKRFDESKQKVFEDEIDQSLSGTLEKMNEKYN